MKLSKLLLLVAFLGVVNVFAEDTENLTENVDIDDDEPELNDGEISFDEDSMSGSKICDKAIEKMTEYHEEIDKDPKCSFNEEYAKEHKLNGVYTTEI